jgi:hypothetical protein
MYARECVLALPALPVSLAPGNMLCASQRPMSMSRREQHSAAQLQSRCTQRALYYVLIIWHGRGGAARLRCGPVSAGRQALGASELHALSKRKSVQPPQTSQIYLHNLILVLMRAHRLQVMRTRPPLPAFRKMPSRPQAVSALWRRSAMLSHPHSGRHKPAQ